LLYFVVQPFDVPENPMSRLAQFQLKTEIAVQSLSDLARQTLTGPDLPDVFLEYLIALHGIIRASEPLLQAGADEAARRYHAGDETCYGLAEYYAAHKQEERDHALWLLQDIEVLGVAPATVLARRPATAIAALAGSQYYWIYHYHPGLLLGYLAVLEGYPLSGEQIARFQQGTGFPADAFRTLLKHAELDPGHGDDLQRVLADCRLDDTVFEGLSTSALLTCGYLADVLNGLRSLDRSLDRSAT
jgi:Iron-containing redox enzyme